MDNHYITTTRRTVLLKYFVDQSIFQKRFNLVIVDVVSFMFLPVNPKGFVLVIVVRR